MSHLEVMGTGEMSGGCRCVSRQVGGSLSHDRHMAALITRMETQTDT